MSSPNRLFAFRTAAPNHGGFTMVELLIVMAIVIILSTMAVSAFAKIKVTTQVSRAKVEIRGMEREISAFATERGSLPPGLGDINRLHQLDPWGHEYVYSTAPTRTVVGIEINSDYDLYSNGPDGVTAVSIADDMSKDDVIRGRDGSFCDSATNW
jgi:general secretion pathway protein G